MLALEGVRSYPGPTICAGVYIMPKKQTEWTRAYNEKAYARLAITVPVAQADIIKAHAEAKGLSVNGLVNRLLRESMGLTVEQWKGKQTGEG